MVKRYELSDAQWQRIESLLAGKVGDPGRTGKDNRLFVNGALCPRGSSLPSPRRTRLDLPQAPKPGEAVPRGSSLRAAREAALPKDKDSLLILSQVVAPVDPRQGKRGVLSYGLKSILKVGGESFSGTSFAQRISSRRQLCGHARDDRRRRKPCPIARLHRCVDAASRRIQSPPPAAAIALLGRTAS
jgi:hypothetical protein